MNKIITLKYNKEFKRAYYKASYKTNPAITTYIIKNYTKPKVNRIGITTGKKIGNACERNRARRIIKAAFRMLDINNVPVGYDFVFVARTDIHNKKSTQIFDIINKHINLIFKKINKN